MAVFDEDGAILGEYVADMIIERELLLELKVAKALSRAHEAQLLAYLKATRLSHGMLINFGSCKFEIRKFVSPFVPGGSPG